MAPVTRTICFDGMLREMLHVSFEVQVIQGNIYHEAKALGTRTAEKDWQALISGRDVHKGQIWEVLTKVVCH